MFDVRTVLVPVDFSACSLAALDHAVALAATRRGTIHLVHVVDPIASGLGEVGPIATGVLTRFQDRLTRLADSAQMRHVRTETHVAVGSVEDEILDMVDRYRVDVIVMGTHGHSGWGHLLLGGTTERVVRRAQCPVLTVKERRTQIRVDDVTVSVEESAVR
jgi:nucleotide-binding universal stress UspA family protein